MISLYPDQEEFIGDIRKAWPHHNRICAMLPTGGGKTRIAARIIEGYVSRGMRVCFIVPRITLIEQTALSFYDLGLDDITYIWGEKVTDYRAKITIASIDTYIRRPKVNFDLVIIDEGHIRREKLLKQMRESPDDRYLWLTATPYYAWIGEYCQALVKGKSMKWLIANNRLAPYDIYAPDVPDLTNVSVVNTTNGIDYKEAELEEIMGGAQVVGNIIENWLEHGNNERTIALAVNCSHANFICVEFCKAGVACEVITAQTPIDERRKIFKRHRDGITRIISSVNTLTEGHDEPRVSILINARPTKSVARWVQGAGRPLRYMEGKRAKIFDHSGTSLGLGYPCDIDAEFTELLSGDDKDIKKGSKLDEEKPEKIAKVCAKCNYLKPPGVYVCPQCGFKPVSGEDVEVDESRGLKKITSSEPKEKKFTREEKQFWYSCLLGWHEQKIAEGKNWKKGMVSYKYKDKFGVWPRALQDKAIEPTPEVLNWIKSQNIKRAKSKAGNAN